MARRPLIFVSWQHFDNVSSLARLNWLFVVHVTLTLNSKLLVSRHFYGWLHAQLQDIVGYFCWCVVNRRCLMLINFICFAIVSFIVRVSVIVSCLLRNWVVKFEEFGRFFEKVELYHGYDVTMTLNSCLKESWTFELDFVCREDNDGVRTFQLSEHPFHSLLHHSWKLKKHKKIFTWTRLRIIAEDETLAREQDTVQTTEKICNAVTNTKQLFTWQLFCEWCDSSHSLFAISPIHPSRWHSTFPVIIFVLCTRCNEPSQSTRRWYLTITVEGSYSDTSSSHVLVNAFHRIWMWKLMNIQWIFTSSSFNNYFN